MSAQGYNSTQLVLPITLQRLCYGCCSVLHIAQCEREPKSKRTACITDHHSARPCIASASTERFAQKQAATCLFVGSCIDCKSTTTNCTSPDRIVAGRCNFCKD